MYEKHGSLSASMWRRKSLLKASPILMGMLLAGSPVVAYAELPSSAVQTINQQTITIKGMVVDSKGEALIGVNVLEVGTSNGTITDFDGNFQLTVHSNAKIKISYIGYQDVMVAATNQKDLKVTLKEDTKALDEVVVIGYGAVRKADLAGSVAVLDNKSFKDQPITRTSDALQGRVSGVQVESNGLPGGQVKIRVRGANSVNKSNDPLYVVDGIIRESGLDGISPEDIQSMQVLKDASSTAIYGARGSNGVILITTKSGKAGANRITFDASVGISNVSKDYDLLGAYDYAQALKDVKGTIFSAEEMEGYKNGTLGVDWQDQIYQTAITQDYKLAITGGNEKTQYYFSGNYMKQEGLLKTTDHERYQAKLNVTSQVKDWLHLTADVNAAHSISHGATVNSSADNVIYVANNYSPTMEIMDEYGNYNKDPYNSIQHSPVGQLVKNKREGMDNVFNAHVDLRFNIVKGLTFTTTNGVDYFDGKNYGFSSKLVFPNSSMNNSDAYRMSLQTTNNLTYIGDWGDHHLTATAVYEATKSESRNMGITGRDLLTEGVTWYNVGLAANRDASNSFSDWALVSGVGRVMYNFADRYLLTGTFRADGSSRFMNDKWGFFPSIAAAWTVSNEKFMKNVKFINELKLRASYGIVGNQAIEPYSTLGLMSQDNYNFGTSSDYTGYWSSNVPAPDLTWEKTNQFDFGIDLSVLNHRLSLGLDFFYKKTTDALLSKSIPGYLGGGSYWVNDGEIENKGVDFSLTAHLFQGEGFNWSSTLNGTFLKNKVKKLSGGPEELIFGTSPAPGMVKSVTVIKEGEPIGTLYGYIWDGLDEHGVDKYKDLNKNGQLDAGDQTVIGHANPDFTFGWNNSFSYKNWDLNMFFTGSLGAQRLNMAHYAMSTMNGNTKFITYADAYNQNFDQIGQGAFYATLKGESKHIGESSKWVEDADYFRLDNISLSYNLSKKVTKFADFRFTVSAQNLFTISGYKGMDPAGSTFSTGNIDGDAGIDMGAYPCPRTFTFGVRMNF